jgi:hypothetical protein
LIQLGILIALASLLAVITATLHGYAGVDGSSNSAINSSVLPPPQPQGIANVGVTSNQLAAGGPLPGNQTKLYRYEWNDQNLTLDESWGPVSYLLPGQTSASACGIMDEWVICMTNCGQSSNVPLSIIAISQANAS